MDLEQTAAIGATASRTSTGSNSVTSAESTAISETGAGGALGKTEFLKLLVTQMKSQDPLKPMDSTAMIAELAQFSSLEQMQNLNDQFTGMRRDNGMALSFGLSGEDVSLALNTGETVAGTVEKVIWQDGESMLVIGGLAYPFSSILSLEKTAVVASEE